MGCTRDGPANDQEKNAGAARSSSAWRIRGPGGCSLAASRVETSKSAQLDQRSGQTCSRSDVALDQGAQSGRNDKVQGASNPNPPAVRKTVTRADLLDAVYMACPSLSRAQARQIFEMAIEEISEALVAGESVKLRSFGLFSVRSKRERIGRNPRTGVEVPIKPRRVLTFKPSPVLSAAVNAEPAEEEPRARSRR
jgi:integration host factor subunit alpha